MKNNNYEFTFYKSIRLLTNHKIELKFIMILFLLI